MTEDYKKEKMEQYQRRLSVYKKHFDIPKEVEDFLIKKYEWYDMIYADGLATCKCGYAVPTDCGEDFLLYSKTYPNDKDAIMSGRVGLDCPKCGGKFLWRALTFIDIDNKIYLTTKSSPSKQIINTYKCDKVSDLDAFISRLNELGFYNKTAFDRKIYLGRIENLIDVNINLSELAHTLFVGIDEKTREGYIEKLFDQVRDKNPEIKITDLGIDEINVMNDLKSLTEKINHKKLESKNNVPDLFKQDLIKNPNEIIYIKNVDLIFEKLNKEEKMELYKEIFNLIYFGRYIGIQFMASVSTIKIPQIGDMLLASFPCFFCFRCQTAGESQKLIFKKGLESINDYEFYLKGPRSSNPVKIII